MKPHQIKHKKNTSASGTNSARNISSLFNQAISLHQTGNLPGAAQLYTQILAHNPQHFDSLHLLGVVAVQQKDFEQGLRYIDQAIAINGTYAVAFNNRGSALKGLKKREAAIESHDRAIQLKPDYAEAYNARGMLQHELKQYAAAHESFVAAIKSTPRYAPTHNNLGLLLQTMAQNEEQEEGDSHDSGTTLLDQAMACFDRAIALQPDYAEAYNNRGNLLRSLENCDQAIANYGQAIALEPTNGEAFNYRGNALTDLGKFDEALASYDQAIALNPGYAEAYGNRGNALSHAGHHAAAISSYDQALALDPDSAVTYNNRGNTFTRLNRPYAAIDDYDHAIKLKPDYAEAYDNCGNVFRGLRQFPVALVHYEKAIALKPDLAAAYANRASVSKEVGQIDFAIESYDEALKYQPDNADWWLQRGHVLVTAKKLLLAIESFERAYALDPTQDFLFGALVQQKGYISDWISVESDSCEVELRVRDRKKCVVPFAVLSMTGSGQLQLQCAQTWVNTQVPETELLGPFQPRARRKKIRIGYFSADFRNHPVSYLTAELFELHNRSAFEVIGFSFGTAIEDEMKLRMKKAFDQFIEVDSKTDQEIAMLARTMEIDIAVDLNGFTGGSRTGIFAMRAAPLQINYLGYPGTMGAEYMDYIIADETVIPIECREFYTEKIIYLPSFQVNDSKRAISTKNFSRMDLGLPEEGFVFCCFNSIYKITPTVFDGWVRILKRVKGSVLFLYGASDISMENLRQEAIKRGLDVSRIIFGQHLALDEHLARYRTADLFLDTLPFNAGTTASDALWAGLPVLTCTGESFASRMAASLLNAIGLPELVTSSQQEYEDVAVELATNRELYKEIKAKLATNRLATCLFDTKFFAGKLENAYQQIYNQSRDGLLPEHIFC